VCVCVKGKWMYDESTASRTYPVALKPGGNEKGSGHSTGMCACVCRVLITPNMY